MIYFKNTFDYVFIKHITFYFILLGLRYNLKDMKISGFKNYAKFKFFKMLQNESFGQKYDFKNDDFELDLNVKDIYEDISLVGLTGGEIFHEMMLRHNVKIVFGYPGYYFVYILGGAILPVFDAIYNSKHFKLILPRHEQGAGFMAQGYARARYLKLTLVVKLV